MEKVYYESIVTDKYNVLVGYTKDAVVRATFNVEPKFEKDFFDFLTENFDHYEKSDERSIFAEMLEKYLYKESKNLKMPVRLIGTDFNKSVWEALITIPYGETRSYKDVAEQVGCEKGYRAVGNANNKNPIVLIVPCHRVIGSNGNLTGFAPGVKIKSQLLEMEGIKVMEKNNKYYTEK